MTSPFACRLDALAPAERARHHDLLRRVVLGRHLAQRELADGLELVYPHDALLELAAWILDERRCCPFLAFEIEVAPGELVRLRVRGPAGSLSSVRQLLDAATT